MKKSAEQNSELDIFLKANLKKINNLVTKITFLSNIIPPFLFLGSIFGLFDISIKYCIIAEAITLSFSLIAFLLNRYCNNKHVAAYIEMTILTGFIGFLGCNRGIGIYLSFALITFLSTLYLDKKLTLYSAIIGYIFMGFSVYIKGNDIFLSLTNAKPTITEYFIPIMLGFTMEFFFVTIVAYSLTKQFSTTINQINKKNREIEKIQDKLIHAFADTVEFNDPTTGLHVKRTSIYVNLIAHKLRENGFYQNELTDDNIQLFTKAAPLHDIGKFCIPNNILTKPDRYTDEEFNMMKIHSQKGHELIEKEFFGLEKDDFVKTASIMAWCHHERFDGKGYPRNLKGFEIPLCARIMTAADVLDALLSSRPYKRGFTLDEALNIFKESRGTQFEPCIVDAVLDLEQDIRTVAKNFEYGSQI